MKNLPGVMRCTESLDCVGSYSPQSGLTLTHQSN